MKVTIDRHQWVRGEGLSSLLRGSDGKMCCVGFYCLAEGKTEDDIRDVNWPKSFWMDSGKFKWLWAANPLTYDGEGASQLALWRLNDDKDVPDREKRIASVFAKNGIEIEFVN